jgi:hypothetical protein
LTRLKNLLLFWFHGRRSSLEALWLQVGPSQQQDKSYLRRFKCNKIRARPTPFRAFPTLLPPLALLTPKPFAPPPLRAPAAAAKMIIPVRCFTCGKVNPSPTSPSFTSSLCGCCTFGSVRLSSPLGFGLVGLYGFRCGAQARYPFSPLQIY